MILHIDGEINKYYVQTLLMVFFPGSTFGENEEAKDGIPEAWVNVYPDSDGAYTSYVRIRLNDRICEATETVSGKEEITISTHASLAVGRAIFAAGEGAARTHSALGHSHLDPPCKDGGSASCRGKGNHSLKAYSQG